MNKPRNPWPFPASPALRPAASPAPQTLVDMEPQDEHHEPICMCDHGDESIKVTLTEMVSNRCDKCKGALA